MIAGAALLFAVFLPSWDDAFDERWRYSPPPYMDYGETLIHRIPSEENISYRMPLLPILAAIISSHSNIEIRHWNLSCLAIASFFILASSSLLGPTSTSLTSLFIWHMAGSFELTTDFSQTTYTLLILITANLLIARSRQPSLILTIALSLSIGASLLCRSPLVLFPPILFAFEYFRGGPSKKSRLDAAVLGIVPYLPLIPWMWLNWILHNRFIPLENGAANSNLIAATLGLTGTYEGDLRALLPAMVEGGKPGAPFLWALLEIYHHPLRYALGIGRRLIYLASLNPLLVISGAWAVGRCYRQKGIAELGLLAAYFIFIHCALAVQDNYFAPLWPILAILSGALLESFLQTQIPRAFLPRLSNSVIRGLSVALTSLCMIVLAISVRYGLAVQQGIPSSLDALDREILHAPQESWLLFRRGLARQNNGDIVGAIADFEGATKETPALSRAWFRLQWALSLLGRPNELLTASFPEGPRNERYDIWRRHIEIRLLRALALQRESRRAESRRELQAALETFNSTIFVRGPNTPQGMLARMRLITGSTRLFIDEALDLLKGRPLKEKLEFYESLSTVLPNDRHLNRRGQELLKEYWQDQNNLQLPSSLSSLADRLDQKQGYLNFLIGTGKVSRALTVAEQLIAKNPKDASLLLIRAELLFKTGAIPQARSLLTDIQERPLDEQQRRTAIELCLRMKSYRQALRLHEAFPDQARTDPTFLLERADLLLKTGSIPKVRSLLTDIQERHLDEQQRRTAIELCLRMKSYRQALRLHEAFPGQARTDPTFLLERVDLLLKTGSISQARSLLTDIQKISFNEKERHLAIKLYSQAGLPAMALLLHEASYPESESNGYFWLERAKLQVQTGNILAARESLMKIKNRPIAPKYLHEEALLFQELGLLDEAKKKLLHLVEQYPSQSLYRADLGIVCFIQGQREEAAFHLRKSLDLDPRNLSASLSLIHIYLALGKNEKAAGVKQRAIKGPCLKEEADKLCQLLSEYSF